jgi:hypothetical protein
MSFFNRGSHGRGRNRGKGQNNFWQRGNKRLRFSIHFDVDSEEFNQLLQTGFLNLAGQGAFHPYPRPERPPYQHHPSISNVHVPPHVSLQPKVPVNDGWEDIVQHAPVHHGGWPTVSLPLQPPPPPKQHVQQISSIKSHDHSSHGIRRLKEYILETKTSKGKKIATHSESSHWSSQSVTSHAQHANDHSHVFTEVNPEASNQQQSEKGSSHANKAVKGSKLLLIVNMVFDAKFICDCS